jgi:hypothetical protein
MAKPSVADPDLGSGAFLTPGSGIRNRFIPDLRSRIPKSYFSELSDNFLSKKFCNSLKFGPNFFLHLFKKKIILHFVKFVATKKMYENKFFSAHLFCSCFWIRDAGWVKIRIRDKHPGSATLAKPRRVKSAFHLNSVDSEPML